MADITFTKGEASKTLPESYRAKMESEGWSEKTDLKAQLAAASGKKGAKATEE